MSLSINDWVMQDGYPSVIRSHYSITFDDGLNICGEGWSINTNAKYLSFKDLAKWLLDYQGNNGYRAKKLLLKEATMWLLTRSIGTYEDYKNSKSIT